MPEQHAYEGRLDRVCERCGKPDRHPIHAWPVREGPRGRQAPRNIGLETDLDYLIEAHGWDEVYREVMERVNDAKGPLAASEHDTEDEQAED